ncbi:N(6)-adenine-specific methyltransferase METTL4-like [Physella acuta]|uniref:N(6)-adenine-specific methyltransferase METTL4-like n=1 Tax=Physella acuta TaxID=109671 RepID=UPI0027DC259A|nr:N(6)-adenine-specific methyltransferase METTL4-like [Physella acuta]
MATLAICRGAVLNELMLQDNEEHPLNNVTMSSRSNEKVTDKNAYRVKNNNYRWKKELYAVEAPFIMKSQAERITREQLIVDSDNMKETSAQKKRKKKSCKASQLTEKECLIKSLIEQTLPSLLLKARELNYIREIPDVSKRFGINEMARTAAMTEACGNLFQTLCQEFDERGRVCLEDVILTDESKKVDASDIIGKCVQNRQDKTLLVDIGADNFIIPPQSSFLTSSFQHFVSGGYKKILDCYDLVVIDPPWINKSVKRKKSYLMVAEEDLKDIPLGDLTQHGSLVCVWVTNNQRLIDFVKDELFTAWSVVWLADWVWLKITSTGEPVYNINSAHKKPYEQLIIGQVQQSFTQSTPSENQTARYDLTETHSIVPAETTFKLLPEVIPTTNEGENLTLIDSAQPDTTRLENSTIIEKDIKIPQQFLLVSVPSCLHSKKPPLSAVLKPYLPAKPKCLELFARNLTPRWCSWGNEPLKHQHIDYYEFI